MILWTSVILGSIIILLLSYLKSTKDKKEYPPGPSGLPFFGNLLSLKPTRYIAYQELGKTYGDVFTVKLLSNRFVILNSVAAIRTALLEKGNVFALRPRLPGISTIKKDKGIISGDGAYWQEHRRFTLKTLRDFGFAKSLSVDAIHIELQSLLDFLDNLAGKPIATKMPFARMTTNVISRMVFGHRLSEDEEKCDNLLSKMIFAIQTSASPKHNLFNIMPFLSKIPFFTALYTSINPRNRMLTDVFDYIRKGIRQHFNTIGDISEPRDVTDALILHKLALDSQDSSHTFDEESMLFDTFDLFIAGTDTTSVTLSWGILLMAINSEFQDKTRSEIREHLGSESFPTMHDRSKLNYTLAVIDEIQRFATIVPSALIHRTSEEVNICGRIIPKDALVIPNIYSVHRDPKLWKHPVNFNPDNFLDDEVNYKASENLIQFSLGKRACLGESLARMEIFVFFVGLMQKYRVSLHDRESFHLEKLLTGIDSFVRHLEDHKIQFHADP